MILVLCLLFLCFAIAIIDPNNTTTAKTKQTMKITTSSLFGHAQPAFLTHGLLLEHKVVFI